MKGIDLSKLDFGPSKILKPGKPKAGDVRPPVKKFKWNTLSKPK